MNLYANLRWLLGPRHPWGVLVVCFVYRHLLRYCRMVDGCSFRRSFVILATSHRRRIRSFLSTFPKLEVPKQLINPCPQVPSLLFVSWHVWTCFLISCSSSPPPSPLSAIINSPTLLYAKFTNNHVLRAAAAIFYQYFHVCWWKFPGKPFARPKFFKYFSKYLIHTRLFNKFASGFDFGFGFDVDFVIVCWSTFEFMSRSSFLIVTVSCFFSAFLFFFVKSKEFLLFEILSIVCLCVNIFFLIIFILLGQTSCCCCSAEAKRKQIGLKDSSGCCMWKSLDSLLFNKTLSWSLFITFSWFSPLWLLL